MSITASNIIDAIADADQDTLNLRNIWDETVGTYSLDGVPRHQCNGEEALLTSVAARMAGTPESDAYFGTPGAFGTGLLIDDLRDREVVDETLSVWVESLHLSPGICYDKETGWVVANLEWLRAEFSESEDAAAEAANLADAVNEADAPDVRAAVEDMARILFDGSGDRYEHDAEDED